MRPGTPKCRECWRIPPMAHLEGTPTKPRVHNHLNTFYAPGAPKCPKYWRIPRMAHLEGTPTKPRVYKRLKIFYAPGAPKCPKYWRIPPMAHLEGTPTERRATRTNFPIFFAVRVSCIFIENYGIIKIGVQPL